MTNDKKVPDNAGSEPDNKAETKKSTERSTDTKRASRPSTPQKGSALKRLFWYLVLVIIIATVAWIIVEKPYQQLSLDLSPATKTETVPQTNDNDVAAADNRVSEIEQTLTRLQTQLSALANQVESIETTTQDPAIQRRINELTSEVSSQSRELNQLSRQLPQQQAQQATQWRLFEAKQTVAAAARLLWGAEDYSAALKLLQIADSQLAGIETASAIQIRQLLAADIARVESRLDNQTNQLALTLAGLQQRIAELPDQVDEKSLTHQQVEQTVSSDATDWRSNLSANWDEFLDTFIRIQPATSNAEPLLTEAQRSAMTMRVELLLTMAQNAVIKGNNVLWRNYIDNAIPLIQALKGNTAAAEDVVSRLQALRNTSTKADEMRALESLDALSQAVSQGGLQ